MGDRSRYLYRAEDFLVSGGAPCWTFGTQYASASSFPTFCCGPMRCLGFLVVRVITAGTMSDRAMAGKDPYRAIHFEIRLDGAIPYSTVTADRDIASRGRGMADHNVMRDGALARIPPASRDWLRGLSCAANVRDAPAAGPLLIRPRPPPSLGRVVKWACVRIRRVKGRLRGTQPLDPRQRRYRGMGYRCSFNRRWGFKDCSLRACAHSSTAMGLTPSPPD
jgi:hypothetical protein